MKVQIRQVSSNDLPIIEKIEKISFSDPYSRNLLEALAFTKCGEFLVAEVDGEIIGYVSAIFEANSASITSIAVHPDYRRKEIARKLMLKLLETLREKRISNIKLEVRESNEAARKLYESLGFELCRIESKYYEDGEKALVMRLSIKPETVKANC